MEHVADATRGALLTMRGAGAVVGQEVEEAVRRARDGHGGAGRGHHDLVEVDQDLQCVEERAPDCLHNTI